MNRLRLLRCIFMVVFATGMAAAQAQPAGDRKPDHEALQAMLARVTQALNTRNLDALAGDVHPGFTVITVDNQKLVGLDAFKKYYAGLFEGPDAKIAQIEVKAAPDEPARFLDADSGVAYGKSEDTYRFKDGDTRVMRSNWSAALHRDGNAWKIVNVHFSANLLDNPALEATKGYAVKSAVGAAVAGLVVGALLMGWLRGRRT